MLPSSPSTLQSIPISTSSSKDGASRIIPIKVERGASAFNPQQGNNDKPEPLAEVSSPRIINNLDDLKSHQSQNKAEEIIRGYSKPVKPGNNPIKSSGGGFDDVMKAMKAQPGFAQREKNSSLNSVESVPSQNTNVGSSVSQQNPAAAAAANLKHVRQKSLPESLPALNRRASESDALIKSRKNVVGELDR